MKPLLHVGLIVSMTLISGCPKWPGPTGPARVTTMMGGEKGYELVRIPALARVEVYQLGKATPATEKAIGGWEIASGPTAMTDERLKRLSDLLCAETTYDFAIAKGCEFKPDVALRFAGVKKTIDLLFCTTCNEVQVYEGDKRIGGAYYDPREKDVEEAVLGKSR